MKMLGFEEVPQFYQHQQSIQKRDTQPRKC
jgi:hypothetical protein